MELIDNLRNQLTQIRKENESFYNIFSSQKSKNIFDEIADFIFKKWGFQELLIYIPENKIEKRLKLFKRTIFNPDSIHFFNTQKYISFNQEGNYLISAYSSQKTSIHDLKINHNNDLFSPLLKQCLITPLTYKNIKIGVIQLNLYKLDKVLTDQDIKKIKDIIHFLSYFIKNILKFKKIKFYTHQFYNKNKLFYKIISTLNFRKLSQLFLHKLRKFVDFDGYYLSFIDEKKQTLTIEFVRFLAKYKNIENIILKSKIPLNQSSVHSDCVSQKENIFIDLNNIEKYGETIKDNFQYWDSQYAVYIPITYYHKIKNKEKPGSLGVLCLFKKNSPFEKKTIEKVNSLLSLFYFPLKNALYFRDIKEQEKFLKTASAKNIKFLEIVEIINNLKSIQEIYSVILQSILSLFGFEIGLLFIEESHFLKYSSGYCLETNHNLDLFNEIDSFFKTEKGYEINILDGATSVSFIRNNYFYFPEVSKILHLPMSIKDRKGIDILKKPQSLFLTPIIKDKKPIGIIQLWSISQQIHLSESDINLLNLLGSFIGSAIANSKIYSLVEKQKHEVEEKNKIIQFKNKQLLDELKLAKNIQMSLIPSKVPEIKNAKFAFFYKPMEDVGGDFFDFIRIREADSIGIFISDVSGHGVPAALITSMLKALLETSGETRLDPDRILAYINDKITGQTGGNFLTAFYGLYNIQNKTLSYARGAHNFPYLIRDKKFILLESKGPIIGAMPNLSFEKREIQLLPGDKLIFYTDGLTEATNSNGTEFEEIIEETVLKTIDLPIHELIDHLYHQLLHFREDYQFEDDVCVVGMEIE